MQAKFSTATTDIPAAIGGRIRFYRNVRGVSQKALAKLLSVTTTCIGEWESGFKPVSADALPLLAQALSVSPDDLLPKPAQSTVTVIDERAAQYEKILGTTTLPIKPPVAGDCTAYMLDVARLPKEQYERLMSFFDAHLHIQRQTVEAWVREAGLPIAAQGTTLNADTPVAE